MSSPATPIVQEIYKKYGNTPMLLNGAFGDIDNCIGVVEDVVRPQEGGTFIKLYGCSYLFKGFPDERVVEGLATAKGMISLIPRKILAKSRVLQIALLVLYIFARKRFYHYLHIYSNAIYTNTVLKLPYDPLRLGKMPNELRRAMTKVLEARAGNTEPLAKNLNSIDDLDKIDKSELWKAIACFMEFVYLFIELDCAYRFRLQDIFGELKKENLVNTPKEIQRLFQILIDRERGQEHKWIDLRRIIVPFLYLSKTARELIKDFLVELDLEKVTYDEDDKYFILRRASYNHMGLSLEERLEMKSQIDTAKGHILIPVIFQNAPPTLPATTPNGTNTGA